MNELILIVEDEADLVATLEYNLEREGYHTRTAQNGEAALEALAAEPVPDLVLLDLMLPDISGLDICRQVKRGERTRRVPVLMLTAKGEEIDKVVGFEVGADDYVVKPFSVRELMLRVRAVLRRSLPPAPEPTALTHGPIRLDVTAHRAWVDVDEMVLTALEFKLLQTFIERRGRIQTRETLLQDVWGMCPEVETRTVDTNVKRLRQKLGRAGAYIETVRGVGYRFRTEALEDSQ
jgi:two-component system phosphate regulon response regulator PhoB